MVLPQGVARSTVPCRISRELGSSESLVSSFWRPAVLPGQGAELQDRLQQFKAGDINLLLLLAGDDCTAETESCSMIIRSCLV